MTNDVSPFCLMISLIIFTFKQVGLCGWFVFEMRVKFVVDCLFASVVYEG